MAERLRVFRGATELNYASCKITKTDDQVVDSAVIEIQGNTNVSNGDTILITKNDGVTTIFNCKVREINETELWKLSLYTNGWELQNVFIENVYPAGTSPEAIVQNIIDNNTSTLTYASSETSGVTIGPYIAQGYAMDIIKDMMDILDWDIRIDVSNNFYFRPKGIIDNGQVFQDGVNGFSVGTWNEDNFTQFFNHVKIVGGFESFLTQESSGSLDTTFNLNYKPSGSMQITVGGTEQTPDTYTVDVENKQVVFAGAVNSPTFTYSYNLPVVVDNQNDSSIIQYGEVFLRKQSEWLNNFSDARRYSQQLLDVYSEPLITTKVIKSVLDFTTQVGEQIRVVDEKRNKDKSLVVKKIILDGTTGTTTYEFGTRIFVLFDWQREVQTRIKKLENRSSNEDIITVARLLRNKLNVVITPTFTWKYNSPVDSFILGHQTLGRLRSGIDYEADCSNNGYHGTWQGTNVTSGSQYSTDGYRLSCADCNGTDHYLDVTSTINGVQTTSFYVNPDVVNSDILQLTATDIISIDNSGNITTSGLTNATVYINGVVGTSVGTGSWKLVTITHDSINADNIEIGRSASYFNGKIDEVMLFSSQITTTDMQTIINKNFFNESMTFTISNLLAYWSMDNPKLGDRSTTPTTVV